MEKQGCLDVRALFTQIEGRQVRKEGCRVSLGFHLRVRLGLGAEVDMLPRDQEQARVNMLLKVSMDLPFILSEPPLQQVPSAAQRSKLWGECALAAKLTFFYLPLAPTTVP